MSPTPTRGNSLALDYKFHIVDVFSKTPFGGNQLAVLPEADGLSSLVMQNIAREFNFSETTFVTRVPSEENCFIVRIFTPMSELAFAGHPTIGTACVLAKGGYVNGSRDYRLTLREGIGPIAVHVESRGGVTHGTMMLSGKLSHPLAGAPSPDDLAAVLSVAKQDVAQSFCASLGLPFCFVQLVSREAVDRCRLNGELWTKHLSDAESPHVFLFSGKLENEAELYARMFAPALGIEEDPATGSACAALVAAVAERSAGANASIRIRVRQGVSMGRPSDIEASADKIAGLLTSVSVGGATTFVASGVLNVPDDA